MNLVGRVTPCAPGLVKGGDGAHGVTRPTTAIGFNASRFQWLLDSMPAELLDQPQKTRPGEELDAGKLEAWLRHALPELSGQLEIAQFPKGYSNLTYWLRVGEREVVL